MTKPRRNGRSRASQSIEPTSTVKLSLVQAGGAIAVILVAAGIYYKLQGGLDAHTEQLAKESVKVDTLTNTVNDLHEKAAVSEINQKNIADKLTDITNRVGTIQLAVTPKR